METNDNDTLERVGESSSNTAARDALRRIDMRLVSMNCDSTQKRIVDTCRMIVKRALSAPPHTGKWMNGRKYEYEYAYCSACGRMQWADWNSHREAEDNIEDFADNYKFCPGCGAKMEGGVYVK